MMSSHYFPILSLGPYGRKCPFCILESVQVDLTQGLSMIVTSHIEGLAVSLL